jgi:hypothetical protein
VQTLRGGIQGTVRELSKGGLFVLCAPQPVGQSLTFHFSVDGVPVDAVGEVRYHLVREVDGAGMGVKFVRLEGSAAAAIARYVDARSGGAGPEPDAT